MSVGALTIAIERYDRHLPLFLGSVKAPNDLHYRALEVGMVPPRRDGIERHRRMLRNLEFDVAEVSLASYIMAKKRGLPLTGIPVFPRRLFSQNHIFINKGSGIRTPQDLTEKRVGLWGFQVTLSVLAKGDLKTEYGVSWERIRWITQFPEEIDWPMQGLPVERAPDGCDLAQMLVDGDLDAFICPHLPELIQTRTDRVRRLFENAKLESLRYFHKRGYYPIMHLLAVKQERVRERPSLPIELMQLWDESKRQSRDFYHDPCYSSVVFARNEYEEQANTMGPDPWLSGLRVNRTNLEHFMDYMVDQKLIDAPIEIEALFDISVLLT